MGLTAGVYKGLRTGSDAWRERIILIDAETGEIDYKESKSGLARSTGDLFAARADLGNVAMVAWLQEEIGRRLSGHSLLISAILYSGSHSGDFIPLDQLDELEAELKALQLNPLPHPPDLVKFLTTICMLADAAQTEQNPIVFI